MQGDVGGDASVDPNGRVTFVNAIQPDTASVPVAVVGNVTATVHRDVAVTFFGEKRSLATGASTNWTFPQTTNGSITYTFRIVPQSGLTAAVADQVVAAVRATLPEGGAPVSVPYVVQTIAPDVPDLPSVGVPELPTIEAPSPPPPPTTGGDPPPVVGGNGDPGGGGGGVRPGRFASPDEAPGAGRGSGSGSGGLAGSYDGASVPVFGELAGLDGTSFDEDADGERLADSSAAAQTLPVAALVAVIALAGVTAALVRTHQAARSSTCRPGGLPVDSAVRSAAARW